MITAIDILKKATENVSQKLKRKIDFHHGHHLTITNHITELQEKGKKQFPAVIVFTERMTEKRDKYWIEFSIPKVAICTLTKLNATEKQRLESNFKTIIYPIFESFEKELQKLHYGYDFALNRTDIPYFVAESNKPKAENANTFNELVDGCIFPITKLKVMYEQCEIKLKV